MSRGHVSNHQHNLSCCCCHCSAVINGHVVSSLRAKSSFYGSPCPALLCSALAALPIFTCTLPSLCCAGWASLHPLTMKPRAASTATEPAAAAAAGQQAGRKRGRPEEVADDLDDYYDYYEAQGPEEVGGGDGGTGGGLRGRGGVMAPSSSSSKGI